MSTARVRGEEAEGLGGGISVVKKQKTKQTKNNWKVQGLEGLECQAKELELFH